MGINESRRVILKPVELLFDLNEVCSKVLIPTSSLTVCSAFDSVLQHIVPQVSLGQACQ